MHIYIKTDIYKGWEGTGLDEKADERGEHRRQRVRRPAGGGEREFFIDNLLVRIHYIIVMII